MFGKKFDNSDHQWREFRSSLPLAILFYFAFLVTSNAVRKLGKQQNWSLQDQIVGKMLISIVGLFLFHGLNAFKILAILYGFYCIGKVFRGSRLNPTLTWICSLSILFVIEFLKLTDHHPTLRWLNNLLYAFPGFIPRWHVIFNITTLRIISFNMDYYYFLTCKPGFSPIEHDTQCKECSTTTLCERSRVQGALLEPEIYTFSSFLAYALYLPLFVAGPIITFNNFVSQVARPVPTKTKETAIYAMRLFINFLLIEALLHLFHVQAIRYAGAWTGFSGTQFMILVQLNLTILWLKLLIIWRFFRLIAILDGILTTENMERCPSNMHSGLAFWRAWHRSFNKWIVRYVYIPLGGTACAYLNIWPIFMFVAIWHDIRLHLLVWSWLICLFIFPELLFRWLDKRYRWDMCLPYYRHWIAAGAGANIFFMGIANLCGFILGIDGTIAWLKAVFSPGSFDFIICLSACFFAVGHIQLEIRRTEKALGINKNY